jgi:hypothetical protein
MWTLEEHDLLSLTWVAEHEQALRRTDVSKIKTLCLHNCTVIHYVLTHDHNTNHMVLYFVYV